MLNAIVERLPAPTVERSGNLRALLFDSSYDKYRGVLSLVYVKDGIITVGDSIMSCYTNKEYEVKTLSILRPEESSVSKL